MVMADFSLADKIVIVTGAGRGLGKAIAVGVAEAGADVVAVSRTPDELEVTAGAVRELGRQAITVPADVTKIADIDRVVQRTLAEFGRIDVLVNNAGKNILQYAVDVTEEAWDSIVDLNLKATFFFSQRVGKVMLDQRKGKIVNMASQMAMVGYYKRAAYCASKGGVAQLTKVLAVEWASHGINVNCVAPTFVETPLTAPMFADEGFREEVISRIPLGKIAQPKDVVGAVIYLSSAASDFVTGHTLLVDGGWVAW
jgi:NAD(P)-dependent dehydrogenase (short-subunit alcohol dehydrogenase family)